MQERFYEESGDVYLWLNREEIIYGDTHGAGIPLGRLINNHKYLFFSVSRSLLGAQAKYIEVFANSNSDQGTTWTTFFIEISDNAWEDIKNQGFAGSRYGLTTGSEKITILIGAQEVEGVEALARL